MTITFINEQPNETPLEASGQSLLLEFDQAVILAKNTPPNSPEAQIVADNIYNRIKDKNILPTGYAAFEALAFMAEQCTSEEARGDAKLRLINSMHRLAAKKPEGAKSAALSLKSSLLCGPEMRSQMLLLSVDLAGDNALELQNLAGNAGELNEELRVELLIKIAESLQEKPYELVMALREFCDAANWTRCPVAAKAKDILDVYSQSPSFIAEVLEREFNVKIKSVPKPANDVQSHLKLVD